MNIKVSVSDIMDRDDGPFWERITGTPGYQRLLDVIKKKAREAQVEEWGEPCPDFDPECPACMAWKKFSELNGV